MRTNLDQKFHGVLIKNKDGTVVPPDQWMVFLAKDNAFPATLKFYRQECERLGAAPEQLVAVDGIIERLSKWREENKSLCKTPDVHKGELIA